MKAITSTLRTQITDRIRNKIDISDLLEDVNFKGENLSNAIISKLRIIDRDISGTNFSNTILGNDKDIFTILRCNIENCNFNGAKFIGKALVRSCNAKNCNFKNADVALASYEYTDFSGSSFCNAIIKVDSRGGLGAIFDINLLKELCKEWKKKPIIEESKE